MMEDVMAKLIEFYVPDSFSKKPASTARSERGKLIELPSPKGIQSKSHSAQWHGMGLAYIARLAVNFAND
jgi:hypothetical protein